MGVYDKCPCRECVPPEREPGCHWNCEKYIEWKESTEDAKARIRYEKAKEYNACGLLHDSYVRTLRNMWGSKQTEKVRKH